MRFDRLAAGSGLCGIAAAIVLVQPQLITPSETTARTVLPTPEEVVESGGHGEGGCSGCYCCFPRTPEGFVSLDDFEVAPATEEMLYQVPHHEWLMLTDLEAVAMDAAGNELHDVRLILYQEDMMGMRTRVRWANCSVYHSARGFAIQPGSKLVMVAQGARVPAEYYWQLSGYLWPSHSGGGGH